LDISVFWQRSGFKLLALAKLTDCEYSLVLYLFNCAVSGLQRFISTEFELSSLLDFREQEIRSAIVSLLDKKMIRCHYRDKRSLHKKNQSFHIEMAFDTDEWEIKTQLLSDTKEALIYPFRRSVDKRLEVLKGQRIDRVPFYDKSSLNEEKLTLDCCRVIDAFKHDRHLSIEQLEETGDIAKILVKTYPIDEILLIIHHFSKKIPTLSLLASSWQHYYELFESETQKIDLLEARKRHLELDEELQKQALEQIKNSQKATLSEEEIGILSLLTTHRYPRRQLFWAYQARTQYPNLLQFFRDNEKFMIPVTSTGKIAVKFQKKSSDH